jgi:hypothetical protein
MRYRKEIEDEASHLSLSDVSLEKQILEVMLDIRTLLNIKCGRPPFDKI